MIRKGMDRISYRTCVTLCLLGASGLFTYLHEKDRTPSVTDVMVYDENALTTRGPVASGGESSDTAANAVVMNKNL